MKLDINNLKKHPVLCKVLIGGIMSFLLSIISFLVWLLAEFLKAYYCEYLWLSFVFVAIGYFLLVYIAITIAAIFFGDKEE